MFMNHHHNCGTTSINNNNVNDNNDNDNSIVNVSSKRIIIDTSSTIITTASTNNGNNENNNNSHVNEIMFKPLLHSSYPSSISSSSPSITSINININNNNNITTPSHSVNTNSTSTPLSTITTPTTPNAISSPLSTTMLFPLPPQPPILQSPPLSATNPLDLNIGPNQDNFLLDSFRYVNDRRYHNVPTALYYLPNDKREIDRLTLQHIIYRFIWDGNFSSPVDNILKSPSTKNYKAKVLDIGCGPGNWLLEMAEEYPDANFVGIDISPIYPNEHDSNKPTNVAFLNFDALSENGLPFPNDTFDFVYQRFMGLSIAENQWTRHIEEIIRITKPGGWIEIMELDPLPYDAGPNLNRIMQTFMELISSRGINRKMILEIPSLFNQKTELITVHSQERLGYIGSWGGKVGEYMSKNLELIVDTLKPYILPLLNLSDQESYEMFKSLNDEFSKYKPYFKSYRHFAQKQSIH